MDPENKTAQIPPCKYKMQVEGTTLTMKVLCRECGQRDLKDRACFSSLLRAFASEVNVAKIILADHIETSYFGKALSTLKSITALSYEMRQLALRQPIAEQDQPRKGCLDCEFRPAKMFPELNETFLRDIGLFYSVFHEKTVRLYEQNFEDHLCGECVLASREDFDYIYSRFEASIRDIVKHGYAVVV